MSQILIFMGNKQKKQFIINNVFLFRTTYFINNLRTYITEILQWSGNAMPV